MSGKLLIIGYALSAALLIQNVTASHYASDKQFDVVVVGATFSGIAAAINAAKYGHSVALVDEYGQVGGLMTGGLSFTDFISFEVLGGTFRDYMGRVESYYINQYGKDSDQVRDCHNGVNAEPHVTLRIFKQMLGEYPNIKVFLGHRLKNVSLGHPMRKSKHIEGASFIDIENGSTVELNAAVFIDATYEGDLAAYAGAGYRTGRESRQEYGETLAGHMFFQHGKILAGSTGEGDHRIQGYNFRLIMTNNPENRRLVERPANYDRQGYLPVSEVLQKGKVSQVFVEKGRDGILRTQMLPNQKADINDIKNSPVRVALLGQNYEYPEGSPKIRLSIIERHKAHILGLIYFLQNDTSVPDKYREEARQWGLAKDEFVENDNFPTRLYIREARRITGRYVFTQNDVKTVNNSLITRLKKDAIAIGDYALNCHGEQLPSLYPSVAEGDFNFIPAPFQVPHGVLIPKGFSNLIVSVAVSASHVGFCGIRLEPTWTALGQASGLTAHLALHKNVMVDEVEVSEVQRLLHKNKAKTIYVSDIDINSVYFEAAQFLGTLGFLHDLYLKDTLKMAGATTYKSLWGTQYAQAYPFHTLDPDEKVDDKLAKKWIERLSNPRHKEKASGLVIDKNLKRGDFLLAIYQMLKKDG